MKFILKSVGTMVLFLPLYVLQQSFQLARATEKTAYPRCQKKPIASLKSLNPFGGWFLYLLD